LLAEKLKREFIELLEKDVEFRYTVAGYIGLSEILKRLDRLEETQNKLWEGQQKLWEEVRLLREGQNRFWEAQDKLWGEVKALREGQNKLWEEMRFLREDQNKLWEEVRFLREGQNRLWEEVRALREGQNRLWEEVRFLREGQNKLWDAQARLRSYMMSGFRDLSRALGVTFEEHAASFLEVMLVEMGYSGAKVGKKHLVYGGDVLEVDLFCEEPLVVGEVTVSVEDADAEVEKVLRRAKAVEEKYGRKPTLTVLCAASCRGEVAERLKELCEKHSIRLILGKEIAEALIP